MKIVKADEVRVGPKLLIYGRPGTGKTTLAAQAPRPTLVLDFDLAAHFLIREDLVELVPPEGLDIARGITPAHMADMAAKLGKGQVPLEQYASIIVDSVTELQQAHRSFNLGERLRATRDDYGVNNEWMRRIFRDLQHAPQTVIYTALEDFDSDEGGLIIRPALSPAVLRTLEAYVDAIVYMRSRLVEDNGDTREERVALTRNMERIRAKDRAGLLPARVVDPTYAGLFSALYGAAPVEEPEIEEQEAEESVDETPTETDEGEDLLIFEEDDSARRDEEESDDGFLL